MIDHHNDAAPLGSAAALTPTDTPITTGGGRELAVVCTVAGNVKVGLPDGTTFTFPVAVGLTRLPLKVCFVFVTGTTATATYTNLS